MSQRRFIVLLLTGFAGFALLRASLGIYGLISYSVNRRTQEIGIRWRSESPPLDVHSRIVLRTRPCRTGHVRRPADVRGNGFGSDGYRRAGGISARPPGIEDRSDDLFARGLIDDFNDVAIQTARQTSYGWHITHYMLFRILVFEARHGQGIARAIQLNSDDVFLVNHGAPYPALQRLEVRKWIGAEWGVSSNNRKARFYSLTAKGRKHPTQETGRWRKLATAMAGIPDLDKLKSVEG